MASLGIVLASGDQVADLPWRAAPSTSMFHTGYLEYNYFCSHIYPKTGERGGVCLLCRVFASLLEYSIEFVCVMLFLWFTTGYQMSTIFDDWLALAPVSYLRHHHGSDLVLVSNRMTRAAVRGYRFRVPCVWIAADERCTVHSRTVVQHITS